MNENQAAAKKPSFFKTVYKTTLFRMWAAGSVCFFAAWGRSGALEVGLEYSLDLIAGLIAVMVVCDLLIVNPVIRLASGKKAFERRKNGWSLFFGGVWHIARVTVLMLLIMGTYYALNVFCIRVFSMDETAVPVPLEPILFGILYGLYYLIFEQWGKTWREKLPPSRKAAAS